MAEQTLAMGQPEHLSLRIGLPPDTLYPFEVVDANHGSNVKVIDNDVVGDASGGTLARGVFINSRESQVGPVDVRGNGGTGMVIGAEFRGGADAPGFTAQPICHGNTWLPSDVAYAGAFGHSPGLEAIIVATSGKRVTYEGAGTPENNVTGNIGDEFHQTDGVAGSCGTSRRPVSAPPQAGSSSGDAPARRNSTATEHHEAAVPVVASGWPGSAILDCARWSCPTSRSTALPRGSLLYSGQRGGADG